MARTSKGRAGERQPSKASAPSPYLAPKELAERWRCSRSSVARITERAGLSRLYLGEGRNGMVRYRREEVEAYEIARRVT